ncbi:hypothetical protein [Pseudoalteromonas sp.]|uniref:hypothetical protein n=1 Tax=Pseudoalteromonas sp. TaxID=53249 RepID=UPI003563C268
MNTQELNITLNRIENAKRLTSSLLEKTQAFAQYIESQMYDLGVKSLMDGKYTLRTIRASVGEDTSLYLKTDIDCGYGWLYVCLDVSGVDADRDEYFLWGDFNARYNKPNRSDIFTFINDAQTLLDELAALDKQPDTSAIDSVIN